MRWLQRMALHETARYLEKRQDQVIASWAELLERPSKPSLDRQDNVDLIAQGRDNLRLLVAALRTDDSRAGSILALDISAWGAERARWGLAKGLALSNLLEPLSLFRDAVQRQVQRMLARRLWVAVPADVLVAVSRIDSAIDVQLLAISEAYLEARDRIIRVNEEELASRNRQLSLLNQEMQHRIKNNLQTVADLLSLEISQGPTKPADEYLRESLGRIKCIAAVHELLSPDYNQTTDATELANSVSAIAVRALVGSRNVTMDVEGERLKLPAKAATSLALVLNELVSNSIEHGFAGREAGKITVRLCAEGGTGMLVVRDDGVGLPPGFDIDRDRNLGLRIAQALISDDLKGTFEMQSDHGTAAKVQFPLPPATKEGPDAPETIPPV